MYYKFTKLHQNSMINKKVFLIARFSVQNFKVSVELWKSYIMHSATSSRCSYAHLTLQLFFSNFSTLCRVWKFFVNKGRTKFFHSTFIKHFHSITTRQKSEVYVWRHKPSAVWNTLKFVILNPFNFSFHVKFSGEKIVL